jgi:diguanylate cyclase (GGDEF)-like protein
MKNTEYDELTGLAKKAQLEVALDRAISRGKRQHFMLALMYVDLDKFQVINDTYGEEVGDEALKKVAKMLQDNLRKEEYIARIGGDEFVILVEDVKDITHVDAIAQKIQELFDQPIKAGQENILIKLCMGIALFPVAGKDAKTLLKHADMALYAAKASGKDRFRYYTPEFNAQSERHLRVAACMQTAMRDKEFYLNYRPIFDLHTNKLVAVEAVLNWSSSELGKVPLSELVPIAHEMGMMPAISHWEFTTACETFAGWDYKEFYLYITISQPQYEGSDFVKDLQELVERLSLDPKLIILKISENIISDITDKYHEKLEELSKIGFQISVDDYGTGASSLSQLKHLQVDSLKIDDSFIKKIGEDKECESIIEAAIKMAHCLDLKAIADGVVNEEQLKFLKHINCDLAQGLYFSEDLDAESFSKLVRRVS